MIEIFSYSLSYSGLALLFFCAFLVGMAKTGVSGAGMIAVPILALVFGGKPSAGLLLPMLIMADLFAVKYYHRHANWHYLFKLFPFAAVGVLIGTAIGQYISDDVFRTIMSAIIFVSLAVMIWMERNQPHTVPDYAWFAILMGLLGGISTMIGNLAGIVMALYLLSMRLPKNEYIGTAAWFFLIVNVFKVPFHVFIWESMNLESFLLSLICLPLIGIGAYAGIVVVKRIPDQAYRWFVIAMTALASLSMITL